MRQNSVYTAQNLQCIKTVLTLKANIARVVALFPQALASLPLPATTVVD